MAKLPKDWGLTTKKNNRGKLEVWGKTDAGDDYRVRTCDNDHITDTDVTELHAADRETYANRQSGAREFCNKLCPKPEKVSPIDQALAFDDPEWLEAAAPVVAAGLGIKSFGSNRRYRSGMERWLKTLKEN